MLFQDKNFLWKLSQNLRKFLKSKLTLSLNIPGIAAQRKHFRQLIDQNCHKLHKTDSARLHFVDHR